MITRVHSGLVVALLCCAAVRAGHVNVPVDSWKELRDKNRRMDFSAERVDCAIAACRSRGLSVRDAEDLFCPVYLAHDAKLPTNCLFIKIEEGLAKGITWQEVHRAVDRRLECLRKADAMIMSVREIRGGQHRHLIQHVCLALESGLPEQVLTDVMHRPARFRYGRMIHVIEAGESLQLSGLKPEQIRQVMNDCVDRDLSCDEVMRVIDVFQHGLHDGRNFNALYATLWVSSDAVRATP